MASSTVFKIQNLDASRVILGVAKESGPGKRITLHYPDPVSGKAVPLVFQTPTMRFPFGLSQYDGDDKGSKSNSKTKQRKSSVGDPTKQYSLSAVFDEEYASQIKFFDDLETRMIDWRVENGREWFGKDITRAVVQDMKDALMWPLVRRGANRETGESYPPTVKFVLPCYKNDEDGEYEFKTRVNDIHGQQIVLDPYNLKCIPSQSHGRLAVFCSMYVGKDKISVKMSVNLLRLEPAHSALENFEFDDEPRANTPAPVQQIDELFSESESEPDSEPEPETKAPLKRKAPVKQETAGKRVKK